MERSGAKPGEVLREARVHRRPDFDENTPRGEALWEHTHMMSVLRREWGYKKADKRKGGCVILCENFADVIWCLVGAGQVQRQNVVATQVNGAPHPVPVPPDGVGNLLQRGKIKKMSSRLRDPASMQAEVHAT